MTPDQSPFTDHETTDKSMMNNGTLNERAADQRSSLMSGTIRVSFVFLILAAVVVRLFHWPALHELRNGDELGYSWGSQRFRLNVDEIPRALSEVNLALERSNRRFLFILGSRQWVNAPRYDTRVFECGPVFGVRDLPVAFKQTAGGVILRSRPDDPLVLALGRPTVAWLGPSGYGTRIYCSPDVASKLR